MLGESERPLDLAPEAEWELWYQDTFDWEARRQVEARGEGLAAGLVELWRRHLLETVREDGGKGFARFNLWWTQERRSARVVGEWSAMVKLRGWVVGRRRWPRKGTRITAKGRDLLERVGAVHSALTVAGLTSEAILEAADVSADRDEFIARLEDVETDALLAGI